MKKQTLLTLAALAMLVFIIAACAPQQSGPAKAVGECPLRGDGRAKASGPRQRAY